MLKDSTDFVRQGACIAMAFVMLQQPEADVAALRKHLEATYGDKHEDNTCKMGAIMACGILDAGARASLLPTRRETPKQRGTRLCVSRAARGSAGVVQAGAT